MKYADLGTGLYSTAIPSTVADISHQLQLPQVDPDSFPWHLFKQTQLKVANRSQRMVLKGQRRKRTCDFWILLQGTDWWCGAFKHQKCLPLRPGMVVHICNLNTLERPRRAVYLRSGVQDQLTNKAKPRLY